MGLERPVQFHDFLLDSSHGFADSITTTVPCNEYSRRLSMIDASLGFASVSKLRLFQDPLLAVHPFAYR